MCLAADFAPHLPVNRREINVSGDVRFDPRDIHATALRQRRPEELTTADDKWFSVASGGCDRRVQIWSHDNARRGGKIATSTDSNCRSAGQHTAERFERFPPHDDVVTHRQGL